jgi:hypothetical protein
MECFRYEPQRFHCEMECFRYELQRLLPAPESPRRDIMRMQWDPDTGFSRLRVVDCGRRKMDGYAP